MITLEQIRDALITLGIDSETLYRAIADDLSRGLTDSARARLNFVDVMRETKRQAAEQREGGE